MRSLGLYLAVAAGGTIGAPARYVLDRAVTGRRVSGRPWGTFVVNVSGTFVLGVLTGLSLHSRLSSVDGALFATGFCGAYTTFSTFTFETVRLLEDGRVFDAISNVAGSLVVGLAAAAAGLAIGLAL